MNDQTVPVQAPMPYTPVPTQITPAHLSFIRKSLMQAFVNAYGNFTQSIAGLASGSELTSQAFELFDLGYLRFQESLIKLQVADLAHIQLPAPSVPQVSQPIFDEEKKITKAVSDLALKKPKARTRKKK